MNDKKLKKIKEDKAGKMILSFIPNSLGINLCSVEDICINRQKNGELTSIRIKFIPNEPEPFDDKHKTHFVAC